MINPVTDAAGNYKFKDWVVRAPNAKGRTVFRAFPEIIDGTVVPQYKGTEVQLDNPEGYISDALMMTELCVCWGEDYHTFISPAPAVLRSKGLPSTPAYTLYWQLYNLKTERPTECSVEIHNLFRHEKGRGSRLDRPRDVLMLQGVLLEHEGKGMTDRDGKPKPWCPVLLQVNQRTAQTSLIEAMTTPKVAGQPLSEQNNGFGNLLGLDGHTLVIEPRMVKTRTGDQTNYFCSIGTQMVLLEEQVKSRFVPWEELLFFPSVEQNIEMIAEAIGAGPTVVGLTGTAYDPYITANLRAVADRLAAPVTVAVPAGVPAADPLQQALDKAAVHYPPNKGFAVVTQMPAVPTVPAVPAKAPEVAPVDFLSPEVPAAPVAAHVASVAPAAAPAVFSLEDTTAPQDLEPFADQAPVDKASLMQSLKEAQASILK